MGADGRRYVDDRSAALLESCAEGPPGNREKCRSRLIESIRFHASSAGIQDGAVEEDGRAIEKNIELSMLA